MNIFTPPQFASLLRSTIPARLPVLAVSAPGIGKTDIYKQAADSVDHRSVIIHPAVLDPTDISGLPVPVDSGSQRRIQRLLDDFLADVFTTKENTLLLLDELGQASPAMQCACAPLLLDRRIGKYQLPDCVTVSAATNTKKHRAGATSILTHIIGRMAVIVELVIDSASWYGWAIKSGIRPEIISFLRFRSPLLHDFDAEKSYADLANYPSPRSWSTLSRLMDTRIDKNIEQMAFAGCIGSAAAAEFSAHLTLYRELPNIDEMISNPKKFIFPKSAAARYAIATTIAMRCSENITGVLEIIEKIYQSGAAEFAVLAFRDMIIRDKNLTSRPEFLNFYRKSKTAKHILGI